MRHWFGGAVPDFVVTPGHQVDSESGGFGHLALLSPNVSLWVYDVGSGERVTDLQDAHGEPMSEVLSGSYGELPRFRGPEGTRQVLAGQAPSSGAPENDDGQDEQTLRFILTTTDLADLLAQAEQRITELEELVSDGR
ncbi:hypothetical protein NE857_05565 [Nocardiopsis exhalans]|uniref:Uncharacterized protein n=1 Tax=Nocardiopsis exhalans TaxID=163604 RepID=A0ABY5D9T6_9ACTN|nr:hypothetical protein [Nocardiopsis exhalans]USY21109.1 hypothetical protein NE857_05565 [Nocardiopsis exhalans]